MSELLNELIWIEELLPSGIMSKRMSGGMGYYLDEKLILVLIETGGSNTHKGLSYPFEIWKGCFFPVEQKKQSAVFLKFPFLTEHPATAKWLYLPLDSENFEENVQTMLREIKKRNSLLGMAIGSGATKLFPINDESSAPALFSKPQKVKKPKLSEKKQKPAKKVKANKKLENDFMFSLIKRRSE